MNSNFIIGVLGGMGSFATLDFFKRLLISFPAGKEWERPRIIIDNRCTMPSRVRAILYKENREELVSQIQDSLRTLLNAGCTHIVLACNTSHVFLEEVFQEVPDSREKVLHIIKNLSKYMLQYGVTEATLIASEGTIISGIFDSTFYETEINLKKPSRDIFEEIRYLIEAVKNNIIDDFVLDRYIDLLLKFKSNNIILGCTEFPILYESAKSRIDSLGLKIWDPLEYAIIELTSAYYNAK